MTIRSLEHELGIKGHERDCDVCRHGDPLATIKAWVVLIDSNGEEASERAPITCEFVAPAPGSTSIDLRITRRCALQ